MSRRTIRILIFFATTLLLALVITQIFWVRRALVLEQNHFEGTVSSALTNVVHTIQKHAGDSTMLQEPVTQIDNNFFRVRTQDTLHPYYLKSLLKAEFMNTDIREDFKFNIYDCFNDTIVYHEVIEFSSDADQDLNIEMPAVSWDEDDGHYFSVYFHNRNKSLWAKMEFWIYSSILVFFVILFFALTLYIILKQKRMSEIKTDFINNMTHEFKTPLSTIDLSANVLLKSDITKHPERLLTYAKIIKTENERLQSHVSRILQLAPESGRVKACGNERIDLHNLLKRCSKAFQLNVSAAGGSLTLNLNARAYHVEGDEQLLYGAFNNIIDNAVKYSLEQPEVVITTENTRNEIHIRFSDSGIGIPKKEQRRIFDKFYRVPTGDVHDVKGFGIGLSFVASVLEKHKGRVEVTSEEGKGSTFSVILPAQA